MLPEQILPEVILIDLHCHLLPAIDDGAPDMEISLAMARAAVEDGIRITACTPHIMPGRFPNVGPDIRRCVKRLQERLDAEGIPLHLVTGADVHLTPHLVAGLRSGEVLSLNDSRYLLLEPPHHVAPPRLEDSIFQLMAAGYHPIITHPERLSWIEDRYPMMRRLAEAGVWMQVTAGAVTGAFGGRVRYWAERMLDEGLVHIVASDAHNIRKRPPGLSPAREEITRRLGSAEAERMFVTRPQAVLDDVPNSIVESPIGRRKTMPGKMFAALLGRRTGRLP